MSALLSSMTQMSLRSSFEQRGYALFLLFIGGIACAKTSVKPEPSVPAQTAGREPAGEVEQEPRSSSVREPLREASAEGTSPSSAQEPPQEQVRVAPPIAVTQMGARLQELGLDPGALPPMSELSPSQRYRVMALISESLGVECDSCHEGKDFKMDTSAKSVARFMWNTMTAPHRLEEGALFCDSCHQGSLKNLNRESAAAVKEYMMAEYSERLIRRRDAQGVECSSCHGDSFEPDILDHLR